MIIDWNRTPRGTWAARVRGGITLIVYEVPNGPLPGFRYLISDDHKLLSTSERVYERAFTAQDLAVERFFALGL